MRKPLDHRPSEVTPPEMRVIHCLIVVGAVHSLIGIGLVVAAIFERWKGWIGAD